MQSAEAPKPQAPAAIHSQKQLIQMVLYGVVSLLLFMGFVLQLAGVGAVHDHCKDVIGKETCHQNLRQFWWAIFFQFFVGIGTGTAIWLDIVQDVVVVVAVFLAMVTVKLMDAAEDFLQIEKEDVQGWPNGSEARTAAAGFVIASIGNFILIFLIGISKTPKPQLSEKPEFLKSSKAAEKSYPIPPPVTKMQTIPHLPQMQQLSVSPEPHWGIGERPQTPISYVNSAPTPSQFSRPLTPRSYIETSPASLMRAQSARPATPQSFIETSPASLMRAQSTQSPMPHSCLRSSAAQELYGSRSATPPRTKKYPETRLPPVPPKPVKP